MSDAVCAGLVEPTHATLENRHAQFGSAWGQLFCVLVGGLTHFVEKHTVWLMPPAAVYVTQDRSKPWCMVLLCWLGVDTVMKPVKPEDGWWKLQPE